MVCWVSFCFGWGALSVTAGAVPASRLPRRVLSASGRRPAPTDAAAETGRWATSHRDVAAPKGGAKSRLPLWGPQKSFARPQTQKKTPGNTGCLVSIERSAVLDPHVPRADALLGVGQGQPVQGF